MAVLCASLVAMGACRNDEIDLSYKYGSDAPQQVRYRIDANARARWDIGAPGVGSYHVRFAVEERIEPDADGSATVSVTMTPEDVEENGLLAPGSEERSFALRIGPNGEKLEVLEVNGVPATALDDDELAVIGTYRPPLPLQEVGLGDEWDAEQQLSVGSVFQQVATIGSLEALHRDDEGDRVAELAYEGEGPLAQTLVLPQGDAALTGDTRLEIAADLDVDEGVLLAATSSTTGRFEARVVPEGGEAPIVGTLDLELDLTLTQISSN